MAESEIKTIRLELPYVKMGPSEDPFKFETYGSAGLFFIELPNGDFQIADVAGEALGIGTFVLPPSLNSVISRLLAKAEKEKEEEEVLNALDIIEKRIDEKIAYLDDKVARLIEMKKESNLTLSSMLQEANDSIGEVRGQNSKFREMIESLGESRKNTPEGGYVTEKTLLDIISSVRK